MRRYTIRIDRTDHVLDVEELSADTFAVRLADGRRVEVSLTEHRDVAGAVIGPHIQAGPPADEAPVRPPGPARPTSPMHPARPAAAGTAPASRPRPSEASGGVLTAPMPGVIIEVPVAVGDPVVDGQTLLVLEAMKMRNDLKAQRAGVVRRIEVQAGDQVRHGDVLLELGD